MGGAPTPPSQDRTPQEIADDEAEEVARREQLAFNKRERQRVDVKFAEAEAKLAKEKGLTEARKAQETSARSRILRGFPSLLGGGGFVGFTLEGDVERLRRAGLTAAEQKRVAAEEAGRKRLAAEEAERQRLAAEAAERKRLADVNQVTASLAEAALRSGLAGGIAAGQRSSRERAEEITRTKLVAGGFDPDDPTKAASGRDLTPLEVQKRIKATSFRGFNPPSLFDEFDPSNALVRLGPAPTSRQRAEQRNTSFQGFNPPTDD